MALAAPPDLSDTDVPVQPLARTYPRGLFIEPHEHVWGQLLYAMSGVMWVETPHEALVVPPQRAVWLPPGVPHGIRVVSDLQMRNIYLRPSLAATLDDTVGEADVGMLEAQREFVSELAALLRDARPSLSQVEARLRVQIALIVVADLHRDPMVSTLENFQDNAAALMGAITRR